MAIKWNPILEGEELHADRVQDIGQAVVDQINAVGSNQIAESGLNWENFQSDAVVIQWNQNIETGTRTLSGSTFGATGPVWMGNPFTNEVDDARDPEWDLSTTPTGDQLTIGSPGWQRIHNLTLDSAADLKSDNSNSLLVLGESYAFLLSNLAEDTTDPTPHHLLFTVVVVKVTNNADTEVLVPLPTTLRWVGADTNTNNSLPTASSWVATGYGATGSGSYPSQKNWIRKNMPFRTLITYGDIHAKTFDGSAEDSTDNDDIKRVLGVYIYACLKNCSKTWRGFGTKAEIRERVLTAIEFRAKVASLTKETAISYP